MENSARTDIFDATLSVMGNVEIGIMVNHHRTTLAKATGLGNGTHAQRFVVSVGCWPHLGQILRHR